MAAAAVTSTEAPADAATVDTDALVCEGGDEQCRLAESGANSDGRRARGCTLPCSVPLWVIVVTTTVLSVLFPVMACIMLIEQRSNTQIAQSQLSSIKTNATGLAQLISDRMASAEGAAYYIQSFVRFANSPRNLTLPHFYYTLAQALTSFNASTTACFTDEDNLLYGISWTPYEENEYAFFYTDPKTQQMCRVRCDSGFSTCNYSLDPERIEFCESDFNQSTMPWMYEVNTSCPKDAKWTRLYAWGYVVYMSYSVVVHKNGRYAGIASVDWQLKEIRELIKLGDNGFINTTRGMMARSQPLPPPQQRTRQASSPEQSSSSSSSNDNNNNNNNNELISDEDDEESSESRSHGNCPNSSNTLSSCKGEDDASTPEWVVPPEEEEQEHGNNVRLVALIDRDTWNLLASTCSLMEIGGYNNQTGRYGIHKITEYESHAEVLAVSQYVNRTLGNWSNVTDTEVFWTGEFAAALVPITRPGITLVLVLVVQKKEVEVHSLSVLVPVIVTGALVLPMLVMTMVLVSSVTRTSLAMKALSNLQFDKANMKKMPRFAEMHSIRQSFAKLKAATLALTKYVSPVVVRQVMHRRDEEGIQVEMDLAHLTIMFVDMNGFKHNTLSLATPPPSATPMPSRAPARAPPPPLAQAPPSSPSAAAAPAAPAGAGGRHDERAQRRVPSFTRLLSKWFGMVGNVVLKNRGMIDKFVEDCVMVLYGAPDPYEGTELCACRSALQLARRFGSFKERVGMSNVPQVHFRAGVHSGDVLVGHLGTADHLNYTVCGICANTASRMTELCSKYALAPLITGDVYERVQATYLCAFIDVVLLRGHRHIHTRVYHLISERERATVEQRRVVESFDSIHRAVAAGHKKHALAVIEHMLNSSWSGLYLTALRLIRSRIVSRVLTRKSYLRDTAPRNDGPPPQHPQQHGARLHFARSKSLMQIVQCDRSPRSSSSSAAAANKSSRARRRRRRKHRRHSKQRRPAASTSAPESGRRPALRSDGDGDGNGDDEQGVWIVDVEPQRFDEAAP